MSWYFLGGIAMGFALLAGRFVFRRQHQDAAADASGLVAVRDLSHLPQALQRSALWALAEGGFERRVVHGVVSRQAEDVAVTAFDLETLRERRGEWAYLPVEPPFRIGPVVSVVACQIDRHFPHYLFKRAGSGDRLADDDALERAGHVAKLARDALGMARSYPAELLDHGLRATLERAGRRDLVIELIEDLVLVYPAARDVVGADAFADLTETALVIVDGVLASSPRLSPRGVEPTRTPEVTSR